MTGWLWRVTIVTLVDFALRQPRMSAGRAPDTHLRFTGRFVNLWGVTDVAAFGDTVVALSPEGDDPLKRVTWLTVEDEGTL
jgi:D-alanyl-D-alanine carboxypeptidase